MNRLSGGTRRTLHRSASTPRRREAGRSPVDYPLLAALLFQGASGVAGGLALMADPSGGSLQIPLDWLAGSPFEDYLVPGVVLFLVLGLSPLAVAYGVWARLSWSRPAALLVGAALIIWIGVQLVVVGYHPRPPLQLTYGLLGILILALAMLPPARAGTTRQGAGHTGEEIDGW